ncbi:hypothetical protein PABG_11536 [Paracoccidioides brasiliensis Pb03]|nr:hypothetical protein PABG_11536 [Paracoccidioides brasiliensis Pb03]
MSVSHQKIFNYCRAYSNTLELDHLGQPPLSGRNARRYPPITISPHPSDQHGMDLYVTSNKSNRAASTAAPKMHGVRFQTTQFHAVPETELHRNCINLEQ